MDQVIQKFNRWIMYLISDNYCWRCPRWSCSGRRSWQWTCTSPSVSGPLTTLRFWYLDTGMNQIRFAYSFCIYFFFKSRLLNVPLFTKLNLFIYVYMSLVFAQTWTLYTRTYIYNILNVRKLVNISMYDFYCRCNFFFYFQSP